MKKAFFKYIVAFVPVIIFLYGCTKTDDPIYEDCQLTRTSSAGDTSSMSTRYYYDANGLLTQIIATQYQIDISYSGNKIIKNEVGSLIEYTIGPDSTAISSTSIPSSPSEQIYSRVYTYDANKYLVKWVGYLDGVIWDSASQVVVNGNVVRNSYREHNRVEDIVNDYSFTADSAKIWTYTKLGGEYGYFYYPWLGRPNVNLMKRQTQGVWGMVEYQYEFNASGFISKIFETSLGSVPPYTITLNVEHDCK